ncbi:hypothetical protein [Rhizobium jaguaris]|uniref:Uncharacterized protein n=1 Tax=Rhizobium jaguaris TaxID=1312183 RepID=A0A387FZ16_9HYPH|nr:hypothetical protein [Rhizobium jaguaris]AYG60436.1 hypothetical protein CCGE525_17690 [Rhizobium jaguaris]
MTHDEPLNGVKFPSKFGGGFFGPDTSAAIAKMTTKSVMSPLLWFEGITLGPILLAAYMMPDQRPLLIYAALALVTFGVGTFAYFALRSPDRLQSEEYLLARKHYEVLQENGKGPKTIDVTLDVMEQAVNKRVQPRKGTEAND